MKKLILPFAIMIAIASCTNAPKADNAETTDKTFTKATNIIYSIT